LTVEEKVVRLWWDAYSCHAIRVGDLRSVLRDTELQGFDVPRWLEKVHGTIVCGYMIVSVSVIQDKRLHQLVPADLARHDYLEELTGRMAVNNTKAKHSQ